MSRARQPATRTVPRGAALAAWAALLAALLAPGALARAGEADDVIRFHQARVARDPDDPSSYTRLGHAYVQKARESGDVTYYGLAEAAYRKALDAGARGPAASAALAALGAVAIAQHRFADAIAHAERALGAEPGDATAYAVLGDAHVEIGEYDKAAAAYARLAPLRGPRHPHARLAYLAFVRGEPDEALRAMRGAVAAARAAGAGREHRAWNATQLGALLFDTGALAAAADAYRDALAAFPGYHAAHAGLARVEAARGRPEAAIAGYRRALAVIPLPQYAAALGDCLARLGRADEARRQYELVEYIGRLGALNQVIHNRELALFYADHDVKPAEAVALARKELEVRRDIYTYDVLAWALLKAGRPAEALAAMQQALRLGTRDARLAFHAGMIHHALGDAPRAREHLARALAINPEFHVLHADRARRTLATLQGAAGRRAP